MNSIPPIVSEVIPNWRTFIFNVKIFLFMAFDFMCYIHYNEKYLPS